jgi:hypothetical protein
MADGEEADNYKAPEKVDLNTLMSKDAEDESLQRYKAQVRPAVLSSVLMSIWCSCSAQRHPELPLLVHICTLMFLDNKIAFKCAADATDPRHVILKELRFIFNGRPDGDVVYTFSSQADIEAMSKQCFVMKVGTHVDG